MIVLKTKSLVEFPLSCGHCCFSSIASADICRDMFFVMDWLENEEVRIPMVFACEWEWFWRCLDQHAPECYFCYQSNKKKIGKKYWFEYSL